MINNSLITTNRQNMRQFTRIARKRRECVVGKDSYRKESVTRNSNELKIKNIFSVNRSARSINKKMK